MGKVIKRYSEFVKENQDGYPEGYLEANPHAPSAETMKKMMSLHDPEDFETEEDGMTTVNITADEKNLIQSEPILQNLISKEKITYQDGEVTYKKSDTATENILKVFFSSIK